MPVEAIPTGALALDLALGIGGVPRGRIVEIFGPESSGKTTLVYHIIAEAQTSAAASARSSTPSTRWTRSTPSAIGVDIDELLVSQPDFGEQALQIAELLIRLRRARRRRDRLGRRADAESRDRGQMGDTTVGLQARLMSQALRKLAGNLNRTKTICIFTNQIREKIGVSSAPPRPSRAAGR